MPSAFPRIPWEKGRGALGDRALWVNSGPCRPSWSLTLGGRPEFAFWFSFCRFRPNAVCPAAGESLQPPEAKRLMDTSPPGAGGTTHGSEDRMARTTETSNRGLALDPKRGRRT